MTGMYIPSDGQKIKGGREPYMKLYVDDWCGGVRGISYELQGFYLQVLILMRERSGGIPNDIDELAEHLKDDRRTVRRMVGALLAKGKLVVVGDQLINPRLQRDLLREQLGSDRQSKIARRPRKALGEFGETSGQSPAKVGAKSDPTFGQTCTAQSMKTTTCASLPDPDPDPEKKEKKEESADALSSTTSVDAPAPKRKRSKPKIEVDTLAAFNAYNDLALRIGIPQAATLTPDRRTKIAARTRQHGGMEAWTKALANVEASSFLRGGGQRGFTANLDFLLQASSFAKVLDGSYADRTPARPVRTPQASEEMAAYLASLERARLIDEEMAVQCRH